MRIGIKTKNFTKFYYLQETYCITFHHQQDNDLSYIALHKDQELISSEYIKSFNFNHFFPMGNGGWAFPIDKEVAKKLEKTIFTNADVVMIIFEAKDETRPEIVNCATYHVRYDNNVKTTSVSI